MFCRKKKDLGTTTVTLDGEAHPGEDPKYSHWVLQNRDEAKDGLYGKLCDLFDRFEPGVTGTYSMHSNGPSYMFTFPKDAGQIEVNERYTRLAFCQAWRQVDVLDMGGQELCGFTFRQLEIKADVEDRLCDAISKCQARLQAAKAKHGLDRANALIDGILS